jgi:hypothetical protein
LLTTLNLTNALADTYIASSANWNTAYNNRITALTTTGNSGAATLAANTLNVPEYTLSGLGGVPSTRSITINGTAFDLSADRTYSVGTVTDVAALTLGTTGTDVSSTVANGTTTPVITLNIPTASATNRGALSSADWSTFNAKEPAITAGTSSQYYRGDKTFQTLNTAAVAEQTNLYFTEDRVRGTVLTGLNLASGGTIAATDSVLQAFGKVQNQISALVGGVIYKGTWNASTNTPTLASGTGAKGDYYIVTVDGSTNLDGISDWKVGDWAIFNGTTWDKVDNTDAVSSVNGYTGAVSLVTGDVLEGSGSLPSRPSQLYFTDARARLALSAGTGISYDNTTGVITNASPDQTVALTGAGTTSISGTYPNFTITSNDQFVGTVTSVATSAPLTGGTITTTGTIGITQSSSVADGYLSSTDWNTFNGKEPALTKGNLTEATSSVLTITGGTGAVIGSGTTIQVKQASSTVSGFLSSTDWTTFNNKQNALTNPVTGTGTTNYLPKFTGASTIGDSAVSDNGTTVTLHSRALSGTSATFSDTLTVSKNQNGQTKLTVSNTTAGTGSYVETTYQSNSSAGIGAVGKYSSSTTPYKITTASSTYIYNGTAGDIAILNDFASGSITMAAGGSSTAHLTVTPSGNLGLGVTPSAWADSKAIQVGSAAAPYLALFQQTTSTSDGYLGWNARLTGYRTFAYITTGDPVSLYRLNAGAHTWFTAPSGTAGNAITFTQAMTLDASGRLGIGRDGANLTKRLDIYDANTGGTDDIVRAFQNLGINHAFYRSQRNGGANMLIGATRDNNDGALEANTSILWNVSNHSMLFGTNNTERMRITSGGSLQVGGTAEPGKISLFQNDTKTYSATGNFNSDLFVVRVNSSSTNNQIASLQLAASGNAGTAAGRATISVVQTSATANTGDLVIQTNSAGTFGERLRIASTGAATFSSSVRVNNSNDNEILNINSGQAKTNTSRVAVSRWHTNESTGSQFKLNLFVDGNATGSSRAFIFQTSNEGVANDGVFSLQPLGGNVGIGTTSPTEKLHVAGNIKVTIGDIDVDSSTSYIRANNTRIAGTDRKIQVWNNVSAYIDVLTLATTGAATFSSSVKTGNPSGYTAKPYKFGEVLSGGTTATHTVAVEIDGVVYFLLAASSPP